MTDVFYLELTQPQLQLLLQALSIEEAWNDEVETLTEERKALIDETGYKLRHCPEEVPLSGVSMRRTWKPDDRVVLVTHDGPYGPEHLRPGVVVSVDEELRRHERLKVRFDDGEERYINPDVMRHA